MMSSGSAKRAVDTAAPVAQLAAFTIGNESYAVDIMRIKEIINPVPITRVPKAPSFLEGVIELRGAILPVIDMRRRFDAPMAPRTRSTKLLIVSLAGVGQRWIVGLIVDGVSEVLRIPSDQIRPAPAMAVTHAAPYFSGVCQRDGRLYMIVDVDALLSPAERESLAGLGDQALPVAERTDGRNT